jgi:hypothetical protein
MIFFTLRERTLLAVIACGAGRRRGCRLGLALVRDLRELREPSGAGEIEVFETNVLAGFVLARASAGHADHGQTRELDAARQELKALAGREREASSPALQPIALEAFRWAADGGRRLTPEQNAEATKACADLRDEAGQVILPAMLDTLSDPKAPWRKAAIPAQSVHGLSRSPTWRPGTATHA